MSSVTFDESPSSFIHFSFFNTTINLNDAIRGQLSEEEALTRDVAVRILKKIRLESNIAAFFVQPLIIIPLTILSSIAILAATLVALVALGSVSHWAFQVFAKLFLSVEVPVLLGLTVWACASAAKWKILSEAYAQQSLLAQEYIEILEDEDVDVEVLLH